MHSPTRVCSLTCATVFDDPLRRIQTSTFSPMHTQAPDDINGSVYVTCGKELSNSNRVWCYVALCAYTDTNNNKSDGSGSNPAAKEKTRWKRLPTLAAWQHTHYGGKAARIVFSTHWEPDSWTHDLTRRCFGVVWIKLIREYSTLYGHITLWARTNQISSKLFDLKLFCCVDRFFSIFFSPKKDRIQYRFSSGKRKKNGRTKFWTHDFCFLILIRRDYHVSVLWISEIFVIFSRYVDLIVS